MAPGEAPLEPSSPTYVVLSVLSKVGKWVPATKLVKLVYLCDYLYFQHYGRTITGLQYQWDRHGPNAVGHAIIQTAGDLAVAGSIDYRPQLNRYGGITKFFSTQEVLPELDSTVEMVLDDVVARYGDLGVDDITAESKKTKPFRNASQYDLLEMECQFPALRASEEDIRGHHREIADGGLVSLEELKQGHVAV